MTDAPSPMPQSCTACGTAPALRPAVGSDVAMRLLLGLPRRRRSQHGENREASHLFFLRRASTFSLLAVMWMGLICVTAASTGRQTMGRGKHGVASGIQSAVGSHSKSLGPLQAHGGSGARMTVGHGRIESTIAEFVVGGGLTVLATWLSRTYGPKVGAIVWVYPTLLYVAVMSLSFRGLSSEQLATVCFSSFPTTMVNAVSILALGHFITAFPDHLAAAISLSMALCTAIGYGIGRFT